MDHIPLPTMTMTQYSLMVYWLYWLWLLSLGLKLVLMLSPTEDVDVDDSVDTADDEVSNEPKTRHRVPFYLVEFEESHVDLLCLGNVVVVAVAMVVLSVLVVRMVLASLMMMIRMDLSEEVAADVDEADAVTWCVCVSLFVNFVVL